MQESVCFYTNRNNQERTKKRSGLVSHARIARAVPLANRTPNPSPFDHMQLLPFPSNAIAMNCVTPTIFHYCHTIIDLCKHIGHAEKCTNIVHSRTNCCILETMCMKNMRNFCLFQNTHVLSTLKCIRECQGI
jgi:hypothetical protein